MNRIAVTVVAGFLGSGKTTLLRRLVRDERIGPRMAVIVNELGALGLDEELIRSAGQSAALDTRQLVSGCICCTLRGGLCDALLELARREPPPAYLVIETSGAARASEVSYAVNAVGFEAPFFTDAVVTVVDAHNAARAHREHPDLFEDQVRTADVVLLNKADLVQGAAEREVLLSWLRPLAPRASWTWTTQAEVEPGLLFGIEGAHSHGHDHGHGHDHVHDLAAVTLPVPWPLDRRLLEDGLEELAGSVFRIKGVVDVVEDGQVVPLLVQAVGDRIDLDFAGGAPLAGAQRRLIFIGAGLDQALLAQVLSAARAAWTAAPAP